MTALHGVPPGRAGRAWLLERLHTAERGVDLLDEQAAGAAAGSSSATGCSAERTGGRVGARPAARPRRWLLRAALLGGRRALRAAAPDDPAQVEVSWTVVMGVRHPRDGRRPGGLPGPRGRRAGQHRAGAWRPTRTARRSAAAAAHAVAADGAVRRLDAEVAATRRRLRAVQDRWIPRLTAALAGGRARAGGAGAGRGRPAALGRGRSARPAGRRSR